MLLIAVSPGNAGTGSSAFPATHLTTGASPNRYESRYKPGRFHLPCHALLLSAEVSNSCSFSLLTSLNARSWTGYKQPGPGVLLALAIICSAHHGTHVSPADIQDGSIPQWCPSQVEPGACPLFSPPQPSHAKPPALQFQLLPR